MIPSFCPGEATIGLLCAAVGSPRQGTSRESPAESHKYNWVPGASPLQGKAERLGSVQPGEEEIEGISSMLVSTRCVTLKWMRPGSFQWFPAKDKEQKTKICNMRSSNNHEEAIL